MTIDELPGTFESGQVDLRGVSTSPYDSPRRLNGVRHGSYPIAARVCRSGASLCRAGSSLEGKNLPTNLAQVYEKCALMLFEQWDQMRGVPLPARFEGRLRGAVGYLAWSQLTSSDDMSTSWPRVKIMAVLMKYLEEKGFDHDEAEEHAGAFVDFCTGRSWSSSQPTTSSAATRTPNPCGWRSTPAAATSAGDP